MDISHKKDENVFVMNVVNCNMKLVSSHAYEYY